MPAHDEVLSTKSITSFPSYLAGKTEKMLAQYQYAQVGNTCTLHCICSAIQLLTGIVISPVDLADELDSLSFFQRLPYRFWKNGPVSPLQQVNLLNYLSRGFAIPLTASFIQPSPAFLISLIQQHGAVVLTTLGWWKGKAPSITCGDGTGSWADNSMMTWHTMIPAVFDPAHVDTAGTIKPWGFINSWVDQGDHLFWMTDRDFIRVWSFYTPLGGIRSTVVVEKSEK